MLIEELTADHLWNVAQRLNRGAPFTSLKPVGLWNLYMVASYLYYYEESSILTDDGYDQLCKWLLENYQPIKHTDLYDPEALKAGSGYHISNQNMPRVLYRAAMILKEYLQRD